MNSTQLHYREACKLLTVADQNFLRDGDAGSALPAAQVHATLALVAAISEMTRQADPEAVATAVGVLKPLRSL